MRYLSTRDPGAAPSTRSFAEVLLAGLAEDGGLYLPDRMPGLARDIPGFAGLSYAEIIRFITVNLISLGISVVVLSLLHDSAGLALAAAKGGATVTALGANFLGNKLWVFR